MMLKGAVVAKRNIRLQELATSLVQTELGKPVSQPYFVVDQETCFHFGTLSNERLIQTFSQTLFSKESAALLVCQYLRFKILKILDQC